MKKITLVLIFVTLVVLLSLTACVPGIAPYWGGGGMMGGGMMGGSYGGQYNPNTKPITLDQATEAVSRYLSTYGQNLVLTEVMEFAQNFYAEVEEKDTGIHAMELLIDRSTARVYPEMGPNMMWNTKYGQMTRMMGNQYGRSQPTTNMTVSPEQAKKLAQAWLDINLRGVTVAEADTFYGYYTLHTLKDGQITGMLSVNGANGAIWYHTWHGSFIDMKELD
ncbi:MAG: hypothetical protein HW402_1484 [Dehalococcoidales bacterium]|nr:hypothetical protein [Dehalococcoidales bacterium]